MNRRVFLQSLATALAAAGLPSLPPSFVESVPDVVTAPMAIPVGPRNFRIELPDGSSFEFAGQVMAQVVNDPVDDLSTVELTIQPVDVPVTAPTPVQTRHRAADRALAKVARERGRLWLEQACHAIALYALQHPPGWLFEDARAWACDPAGCAVKEPANPKAWGGVVRRLVARGVIEATGAVKRSASNACPKPTWRRK